MSDTQTSADTSAVYEEAREVLEDILERMGLDASVEILQEDDRIRLDIDCDRPDRIVGRRGQVIDALQHLIGKIVFQKRPSDGPPPRPVVVDADGYREKYASKLRSLGERMAKKAVDSGRTVPLDPMNAYDRRIIHMALADSADVTTRSEGEGDDRHLLIVPVSAEA